jgi:hypothetical protein
MAKLFERNPEMVATIARRNSSLQGAYMIMAARALGLDCGPMSGFDEAKVDEEFFSAGKPCFGCDQESGTPIEARSIPASRGSRSLRRARCGRSARMPLAATSPEPVLG